MNNTPINLTTASDAELQFAVVTALGWRRDPSTLEAWIPPGERAMPSGCYYTAKPADYVHSLDAAFTLLGRNYDISFREGTPQVAAFFPLLLEEFKASAPTLCRAICGVYLRSKGVAVIDS